MKPVTRYNYEKKIKELEQRTLEAEINFGVYKDFVRYIFEEIIQTTQKGEVHLSIPFILDKIKILLK